MYGMKRREYKTVSGYSIQSDKSKNNFKENRRSFEFLSIPCHHLHRLMMKANIGLLKNINISSLIYEDDDKELIKIQRSGDSL